MAKRVRLEDENPLVNELCLMTYKDQLEVSCAGDAEFQRKRLTAEYGEQEAMRRVKDYSLIYKPLVTAVLECLEKRGEMK